MAEKGCLLRKAAYAGYPGKGEQINRSSVSVAENVSLDPGSFYAIARRFLCGLHGDSINFPIHSFSIQFKTIFVNLLSLYVGQFIFCLLLIQIHYISCVLFTYFVVKTQFFISQDKRQRCKGLIISCRLIKLSTDNLVASCRDGISCLAANFPFPDLVIN